MHLVADTQETAPNPSKGPMWWVRTWLHVVPFHDSASEWSVPSELRVVPTAMQAVVETQDIPSRM